MRIRLITPPVTAALLGTAVLLPGLPSAAAVNTYQNRVVVIAVSESGRRAAPAIPGPRLGQVLWSDEEVIASPAAGARPRRLLLPHRPLRLAQVLWSDGEAD